MPVPIFPSPVIPEKEPVFSEVRNHTSLFLASSIHFYHLKPSSYSIPRTNPTPRYSSRPSNIQPSNRSSHSHFSKSRSIQRQSANDNDSTMDYPVNLFCSSRYEYYCLMYLISFKLASRLLRGPCN